MDFDFAFKLTALVIFAGFVISFVAFMFAMVYQIWRDG